MSTNKREMEKAVVHSADYPSVSILTATKKQQQSSKNRLLLFAISQLTFYKKHRASCKKLALHLLYYI